MEIAFFNGDFLPKSEVKISPDDRGFLFADGVYEVMKWYGGFFFDMEGHIVRLKRSLRELKITWEDPDSLSSIARELISRNGLDEKQSLVYIQVTRGVAKRTHHFPLKPVKPTIYANAWSIKPEAQSGNSGIKVMLKDEPRWNRCDIKSVALLANTLSFQEAYEQGFRECIFNRNGIITEGSHSNIFFVINDTLVTHPESNHILSGITRKNIIPLALKAGIKIREEGLRMEELQSVTEAFITNTSAEITPVIEIGGIIPGNGIPGPVTLLLREKFDAAIDAIRAASA
jgi:D-alanine transaminase